MGKTNAYRILVVETPENKPLEDQEGDNNKMDLRKTECKNGR
jgi:hypothetical protein